MWLPKAVILCRCYSCVGIVLTPLNKAKLSLAPWIFNWRLSDLHYRGVLHSSSVKTCGVFFSVWLSYLICVVLSRWWFQSRKSVLSPPAVQRLTLECNLHLYQQSHSHSDEDYLALLRHGEQLENVSVRRSIPFCSASCIIILSQAMEGFPNLSKFIDGARVKGKAKARKGDEGSVDPEKNVSTVCADWGRHRGAAVTSHPCTLAG